MNHDNISFVLAGAGAFVGAMVGMASGAWWLASKFNNVYKRMAEHELADERRFNKLKIDILNVTIQGQASAMHPTRQ